MSTRCECLHLSPPCSYMPQAMGGEAAEERGNCGGRRDGRQPKTNFLHFEDLPKETAGLERLEADPQPPGSSLPLLPGGMRGEEGFTSHLDPQSPQSSWGLQVGPYPQGVSHAPSKPRPLLKT